MVAHVVNIKFLKCYSNLRNWTFETIPIFFWYHNRIKTGFPESYDV